MSLAEYQNKFRRLVVNTAGGRASPHKLCMLLRNGLALCPNMHWAMDRNLIAPGPDLKWHVSAALDKRVPDFRMFVDLEGVPLFPSREPRFTPKREVLEWRIERLRSQLPLDF